MQMRFVAKTTINLGLILTSALFTSEKNNQHKVLLHLRP